MRLLLTKLLLSPKGSSQFPNRVRTEGAGCGVRFTLAPF